MFRCQWVAVFFRNRLSAQNILSDHNWPGDRLKKAISELSTIIRARHSAPDSLGWLSSCCAQSANIAHDFSEGADLGRCDRTTARPQKAHTSSVFRFGLKSNKGDGPLLTTTIVDRGDPAGRTDLGAVGKVWTSSPCPLTSNSLPRNGTNLSALQTATQL
jgi:hypothetical protein